MTAGPSTRTRDSHKSYMHHLKQKKDGCTFCNFALGDGEVIQESQHFWVVDNIFPYDIWDDLPVTDHLMIIPKRHIIGMGEFSDAEVSDYFSTMTRFEKKGYSLYARAPKNLAKSVVHQHSHLIKLGNTPKKFLFYVRKPHLLISK